MTLVTSAGQQGHGQPDMWDSGRSDINRPGSLQQSVNAGPSRCLEPFSTLYSHISCTKSEI